MRLRSGNTVQDAKNLFVMGKLVHMVCLLSTTLYNPVQIFTTRMHAIHPSVRAHGAQVAVTSPLLDGSRESWN